MQTKLIAVDKLKAIVERILIEIEKESFVTTEKKYVIDVPKKKLYPTPGPDEFWDKETCKEALKRFKTPKVFKENFPKGYEAIIKYGWHKELFPGKSILKARKGKYDRPYPNHYWENNDNLMNVVNKYKSTSELKRGCKQAYSYAERRGILHTFYPLPHAQTV